MHLAGPNLNPSTFRDGMFRAPPSATGMSTVAASLVRREPVAVATTTSPSTTSPRSGGTPRPGGEDELGKQGVGLYRYVDGGKRYMPGQQPKAPVAAFDPQGTITGAYESYPEGEAPPDYPRPG